MLVVSWNIWALKGVSTKRLAAIVARLAAAKPDIVLLQEVGAHVAEPLVRELEGLGLNASFGGVEDARGKPYGNLIASVGEVRGVPAGWAKAPWPQLLTRATVTLDGQAIDVLSAHMPNGAGNGWKKIETFEALTAALAVSPKMPRILGGDFNEPWKYLPDGDLLSFGAKRRKDGSYTFEGDRTDPKEGGAPGVTRPRRDWDIAVKSILGRDAAHGLRHVYQAVGRGAEEPATHVVRGQDRFFDHLLVSEDFAVEDAGFFHEWREKGPSDHSAAWAKVRATSPGAAP